MENIVTLFLLFTYSTLLGLVAFKLLIYDKRKARQKLRERARRSASKEDFLIKLTDPVFNAQCEINRAAKTLRKKYNSTELNSETTSELNSANSASNGETVKVTASIGQSEQNNLKLNKIEDKILDIENAPLKYELDERTLGLLINTLSYDDFAVLYEKFLYAKDENEICDLISQLQNFTDDDRIIMIVTPLLSHSSLKVQRVINDFITRNNIYLKADEMADIIENSEFYETQHEPSENRQFVPLFSTDAILKHSMPQGGAINSQSYVNAGLDLDKYEPELTIEKEVFEKQPHELIIEAYQTEDKDRLFALSCALAQYNDPAVLEAMIYINAKLNGENVAPKIIKNIIKKENNIQAGSQLSIKERKTPPVQKYEFGNVGDIFKRPASEIKAKQGQAGNLKGADGKNSSSAPDQKNSYIKGMRLVNIAKYSKFDEIFPEAINNLNDDSAYVRCCAITALKTIANNCFKQNLGTECQKTKETILSHMVFEKNPEVSSLCAKAVAEIENFVNTSDELMGGDEIKTASGFINKQINHESIDRRAHNNIDMESEKTAF